MLQAAKIKIRDLKDLQDKDVIAAQNNITPLKKCKKSKFTHTTSKKQENREQNNCDAINNNNNYANLTKTTTKTKTATKKLTKLSIKETPANQKTIDSYFTSCAKTYEIKQDPAPATLRKQNEIESHTVTITKNKSINKNTKTGRKRLFVDTETEPSSESNYQVDCKSGNSKLPPIIDYITIDDSDDDNEEGQHKETESLTLTRPSIPQQISTTPTSKKTRGSATSVKLKQKQNSKIIKTPNSTTNLKDKPLKTSQNSTSETSVCLKMSHTSTNITETSVTSNSTGASFSRRIPKPCPPYKIIENTTFAVDAFQFGYIENVTHYFLTHFHADHYIGLTKSFAMPLFVSPITARLLRTFIPVDERYIHILNLNEPQQIDNIEITALDANHCPGAIILVFKFLNTGKCILHTGDFRAWFGMESEPIFWNNFIHTIYLDTTYICDKYAFCSQYESIEKAKDLIEKFYNKNPNKKILYICGAYIVGKEKFWCNLAQTYELKVWAEGNRYKALKAIDDEEYNKLLVEDPFEANMHIIAMGKLTYFQLVDYFKTYEQHYDAVLALRPSGWEKDTKPRLSSKINLVGIEYSEHSSYDELKRFVKFLKPEKVISTVPTGKDLMITAKIPENWYKYDKLKPPSNYQPTIDSILGEQSAKQSSNNTNIRMPNIDTNEIEHLVSPLKSLRTKQYKDINNLNQDVSNDCLLKPLKFTPQENIIVEKSCDLENTQIPENQIKTSAISTHSSQEFESDDLVINQKKPQTNTAQLKKRNTNIKNKMHDRKLKLALNSEECFETSNILLKEKKAPVIEKQTNSKRSPKFNKTSNNNSSQQKITSTTENNQEFEIPINVNTEDLSTQQRRITRSKSSSCSNKNLTQTKSNTKTSSSELEISSKSSRGNVTVSAIQSQTKTKLSKLKSKKEIYDNSKSFGTSLPQTQIKQTTDGQYNNVNYKSSSSNKTTSIKDHQSQDKFSEPEISSKSSSSNITTSKDISPELEKKSSCSNITSQTHSEAKTQSFRITSELNNKNNLQFLTKSQENPILKSTTTTSRESISSLEMPSTTKYSQTSKRKSKKHSDDVNQPIKPKKSKRCENTTKPKTNDIIPNIMYEKLQGINTLNLSQMACTIIESKYQRNPDNSNDHIPTELLTDEEDEQITNEPKNRVNCHSLSSSSTTTTSTKDHFTPERQHIQNSQFLINSEENAILKSTTTTSSKSISSQEMPSSTTYLQKSKIKSKQLRNTSSKSNSEQSLDDGDQLKKPKRSKRLETTNVNDIISNKNYKTAEDMDTLNFSQFPRKLIERQTTRTATNEDTYFNQTFGNTKSCTIMKTNITASNHSVTEQNLLYQPSTSLTGINSKVILSNIFNENADEDEDEDELNISQKVCKLMEAKYKKNPDNSQDHIPQELLTDDDDDDITFTGMSGKSVYDLTNYSKQADRVEDADDDWM